MVIEVEVSRGEVQCCGNNDMEPPLFNETPSCVQKARNAWNVMAPRVISSTGKGQWG